MEEFPVIPGREAGLFQLFLPGNVLWRYREQRSFLIHLLPMAAIYTLAVRAQRAWLEHTLGLGPFSVICCSLA